MKEITQENSTNQESDGVAPGYAWLLVTGLLLAFIFLPIVVA